MQTKRITEAILLFALLSGSVYADAIFPPERINCRISSSGLSCGLVNRDYLQEDHYTGDMRLNRDAVFYFVSGSAHFTPSTNEVRVYYTYKNYNMQSVRLRTVDATIKPDLTSTGWEMLTDDLYVCNAGYMSCPIVKN